MRSPALTRFFRDEVFAAPERVDAALIDHAYRSSHRPGAGRTLAALTTGQLDDDVRELLGEIDVPVSLFWGRHATCPRVEQADLWLSRLADGHLEVFEASGLAPHLEESGPFAEAVAALAARCGATG